MNSTVALWPLWDDTSPFMKLTNSELIGDKTSQRVVDGHLTPRVPKHPEGVHD